jgi:hypothetical protein
LADPNVPLPPPPSADSSAEEEEEEEEESDTDAVEEVVPNPDDPQGAKKR